MDERRERQIRELHRRRQIVAQELKAYLSPPGDTGLWAVIGAQPEAGKVMQFVSPSISTRIDCGPGSCRAS